ncbi:pantetheine-phosphate adenylyltransferase, partial [Vibrio harveyi]
MQCVSAVEIRSS